MSLITIQLFFLLSYFISFRPQLSLIKIKILCVHPIFGIENFWLEQKKNCIIAVNSYFNYINSGWIAYELKKKKTKSHLLAKKKNLGADCNFNLSPHRRKSLLLVNLYVVAEELAWLEKILDADCNFNLSHRRRKSHLLVNLYVVAEELAWLDLFVDFQGRLSDQAFVGSGWTWGQF